MPLKHSLILHDRVEYDCWLVFDEAGSLRLARREPALAQGERGMYCRLIVPRALFATPQLRATITIADSGPPAAEINVAAGADALRQALGCDVDLRVVTPEGEHNA